MITEKIYKYKNSFYTILFISLIYISKVYKVIFPVNYQQDDVSELRVVFYNDLFCAVRYGGDNHPLLTLFLWLLSKFTLNSEYVLSSVIVIATISSFFLMFKILNDHFSFNIAIFGLIIFIFSPIVLTYSLSLKQYIFELFASVYSMRFLQMFFYKKITNYQYSIYILFSTILVLVSFVNLLPFIMTILFILYFEKKIKVNQLLISLIFFIPFGSFFLDKLQRVSFGGYWDRFFLFDKYSSPMHFIENTYFLATLFIKSLFVENLLVIGLFIFIGALIVPFFINDKLIKYSLTGLILLFLFSALRIYPLGAGRTDLVFLPFFIFLMSAFVHWSTFKIPHLYTKFILFLFLTLYALNSYTNSEVYYKDETVFSVIETVKETFNNEDTIILVEKDQYPSILYYSRYFSQSVNKTDPNYCEKYLPNINNLYVSSGEKFYLDYSSTPIGFLKSELLSTTNNTDVYLIGIELEGTVGSYRNTVKILETNLFFEKSLQKLSNGIVIGHFVKDG